MRRAREVVAIAAVAAAALVGVAFDASSEDVSAPAAGGEEPAFIQRSEICPPQARGLEARAHVAVASSATEPVMLAVGPGAPRRLHPGNLVARAAGASETTVTGYGGRVAASLSTSVAEPVPGAAAARCSQEASSTWYFPAGSSALGADERLLLVNPFGDEAVARVVFYTPEGLVAKANLADVAVPAGRSVEVAVNDFVLREPLLSAAVRVTRGRVVAWRAELDDGDRGSGAHMSLGAPAASREWYFPAGVLGPGYDERITLTNPSPDEAVVTITLANDRRVVQPPELVELAVAPESSRVVALADIGGAPRRAHDVSAWVTSANAVPVIAERTVRAAVARRAGVASEVGATQPARRWLVGPAALRPSRDAVAVMNPGADDASVTVTLLRARGGALRPRALRGIEVPAGLRATISLQRWTRGEALGASVAADRGVVAERWSYSGGDSDLVALMGTPVTPSAPGS